MQIDTEKVLRETLEELDITQMVRAWLQHLEYSDTEIREAEYWVPGEGDVPSEAVTDWDWAEEFVSSIVVSEIRKNILRNLKEVDPFKCPKEIPSCLVDVLMNLMQETPIKQPNDSDDSWRAGFDSGRDHVLGFVWSVLLEHGVSVSNVYEELYEEE